MDQLETNSEEKLTEVNEKNAGGAVLNKLSCGETIFPTPIAVDLCPCADGCAVHTALVAWLRHCMPSWPRWD